MSGRQGRSGRKKQEGMIYFRPLLGLREGKHDQLIEALRSAPPHHQGRILVAVLESGQAAALKAAADITRAEAALAAQERTEINTRLAGLGSEWDE